MQENEYIEMLKDTSQLVARDNILQLSNAAVAYKSSGQLVNNVEFWKWMSRNYPKNLGNAELIKQTAKENGRWLKTQIQGKGYEFDYMVSQRGKLSKALSVFEAGDCPTQPGIDIIERNLISGTVKETYQNKAYVSANMPDLHNTPSDAIVVTNKEKIQFAKSKGFNTQEYMKADEIVEVRDTRYNQALKGKADTTYKLKNVVSTSAKAGAVGAVIGMTAETVALYQDWKSHAITDKEYLEGVLKAGGESGVVSGTTTAIMIPVKSVITAAGVSNIIIYPVAVVVGTSINNIVAPCFGRGKYRQILNEAKYYESLNMMYEDLICVMEQAAEQYTVFMQSIKDEVRQYNQMREISTKVDEKLKELYDSI